MDVARRDEANLRVLRRFVPGIKDICDQASHAACYRFNFENGAWEEMKISGVLFVLERSEPGRYELFILNRLGLKNFELDLKSTVTFYQFGDILIFNTYDECTIGIWIYDSEARERIRDIASRILKSSTIEITEPGASAPIPTAGGFYDNRRAEPEIPRPGSPTYNPDSPRRALAPHWDSESAQSAPGMDKLQRIPINSIFEPSNTHAGDPPNRNEIFPRSYHPTINPEMKAGDILFFTELHSHLRSEAPTFTKFASVFLSLVKEERFLRLIYTDYCRRRPPEL